jgi:hypothetical protein
MCYFSFQLGVTPLPDNLVSDKYYYQVIVFTGLRKNAGTTSKVILFVCGIRFCFVYYRFILLFLAMMKKQVYVLLKIHNEKFYNVVVLIHLFWLYQSNLDFDCHRSIVYLFLLKITWST